MKTEPNGPKRWEKFDFELACAELCGKGHYSMRRIFKIVSQKNSMPGMPPGIFLFVPNCGKEDDPNKDKGLDIEISQRAEEFSTSFKSAVESTVATERTLTFNHIGFETGSVTLSANSKMSWIIW
ncbi:MAG: hypothetical protein R2778_08695 [Saprospiraceae bacterium]